MLKESETAEEIAFCVPFFIINLISIGGPGLLFPLATPTPLPSQDLIDLFLKCPAF